ncbi:hypothetical protein ACFQ0G_52785 [Streptomyces chiangmaiensis]
MAGRAGCRGPGEAGRKRTSPARPKSAAEAENEKLRRQVERLEKAARNKAALEVMGKASALLEMISEGAD